MVPIGRLVGEVGAPAVEFDDPLVVSALTGDVGHAPIVATPGIDLFLRLVGVDPQLDDALFTGPGSGIVAVPPRGDVDLQAVATPRGDPRLRRRFHSQL